MLLEDRYSSAPSVVGLRSFVVGPETNDQRPTADVTSILREPHPQLSRKHGFYIIELHLGWPDDNERQINAKPNANSETGFCPVSFKGIFRVLRSGLRGGSFVRAGERHQRRR